MRSPQSPKKKRKGNNLNLGRPGSPAPKGMNVAQRVPTPFRAPSDKTNPGDSQASWWIDTKEELDKSQKF